MEFTHFNTQGRAKMVDVTEKSETFREAVAQGKVVVSPDTMSLIKSGGVKKGDVLTVAQVAGVMAAKKTSDIIPMCHPLPLSSVDLSFEVGEEVIVITATAKCKGSTGVEMEALTAVSAAALTIYDMCKAIQRDIEITDIRLLKKSGGKSGLFQREEKSAKVEAVCISEKKGIKKHPVSYIELQEDYGILGDAHAGKWHRQVSLLAKESVDTLRDTLPDLKAGDFAENILTAGITLKALPIGTKLSVGEAILEITQIGKECHQGCEIQKLTGKCVMPKEGVFARVIKGGRVKQNDSIEVIL